MCTQFSSADTLCNHFIYTFLANVYLRAHEHRTLYLNVFFERTFSTYCCATLCPPRIAVVKQTAFIHSFIAICNLITNFFLCAIRINNDEKHTHTQATNAAQTVKLKTMFAQYI